MQALTIRFQTQTIRVPLPRTEVNVGASAANEIAIPFPGVSRVHARLTPTREGVLLVDLGSKNQLVVNGKRTNRAELAPGIVVHLGQAMLTIEDASTGDLVAAYPIDSAAGRRATATHTDPLTRGGQHGRSSAALAMVRDLERMTGAAIRQSVHDLLFSAREILAAECVLLFDEPSGGEMILLATAGAIEREFLDAASVAAVSRRDGVRVLTSPCGPVILATRRTRSSIGGIAALLATEPLSWEEDFAEYLAMKLSSTERSAPHALPATTASSLAIPDGMITGTSPAMTRLLDEIAATVHSRLDVLLLGETGTGKELFARMIHASGPTAGGPFIAINCAAIPQELLEAELFGVQARVATGVDPRPGRFAQANGGSIFLDEVGELSDPLQAKLLRVIQEREILPLGASAPRKIDVRVIAASNRDLHARAVDGSFRADLYYRLNGLQFHLPPLRERREDIVPLAIAFATATSAEYGTPVRGLTRRAMELLMEYEWPGNVRELRAEVARAVLRCGSGAVLRREHFRSIPVKKNDPEPAVLPPAHSPDTAPRELQPRIDAVERNAIIDALRAAAGNKSLAARILGITRNGLALKMRRLNLR